MTLKGKKAGLGPFAFFWLSWEHKHHLQTTISFLPAHLLLRSAPQGLDSQSFTPREGKQDGNQRPGLQQVERMFLYLNYQLTVFQLRNVSWDGTLLHGENWRAREGNPWELYPQDTKEEIRQLNYCVIQSIFDSFNILLVGIFPPALDRVSCQHALSSVSNQEVGGKHLGMWGETLTSGFLRGRCWELSSFCDINTAMWPYRSFQQTVYKPKAMERFKHTAGLVAADFGASLCLLQLTEFVSCQ